MGTKNEGVLTSFARKVGSTAGAIVAKTTQFKDEVVKMGAAAASPSPTQTRPNPPEKAKTRIPAKKAINKKVSAKKPVSRVSGKTKKTAKKQTKKTSARRK